MPKYTPSLDTSLTLSELTQATFPGGSSEDQAAWHNRLRVFGIRNAFGLVSGGEKSGRHRRYDGFSIVIAKAICTLVDEYKVHSDVAVKIGHYIRENREQLDCPDPVLVLGDWDEEDGAQAPFYQIGCRDYMLEQITTRRFRHVLLLMLEDPQSEGDLT